LFGDIVISGEEVVGEPLLFVTPPILFGDTDRPIIREVVDGPLFWNNKMMI